MKNNKKGFTLIELLVVIAILGLLTTIALVSLGGARSKARDARRVSDIKQLQTALEMYYTASSTYPTVTDLSTDTYFAAYMKKIPTDPSKADCAGALDTYTYTSRDSGASYTINYCLKDPIAGASASKSGINTATPAGIAE